MAAVDVVDETFLAVPPERLAREFADPARWRRLWPDLDLRVFADRGPQGVRWSVVGDAWRGSMEVWLEAVGDGTVLHWFLRVDPVGAPLGRRAATREAQRRQRAAKVLAFALKDRLEAGRPPGVPPAHPDEGPITFA
ncbi:polyketide cyclase / dehydrase and lipid transport [Actinomycetospora cinnamomea]|uniref:polyketide cyclase / dehydrase and lipid transport n=1 Tax=Actinomycetospora cinnamomea TaxID=663609 RepID=UPI000E30E13C|nr:polyketide cyclase / dehydrase and lipid transport [Actinomycetospora cinnamomea]